MIVLRGRRPNVPISRLLNTKGIAMRHVRFAPDTGNAQRPSASPGRAKTCREWLQQILDNSIGQTLP